MKSNYRRLGEYIREVKVKNTELIVDRLLGINIDKYFMPSVANVVGTDMSKYKIVKKGQFACNRMHVGRDKRLPVALLTEHEEIIVSPAYDVFEIIDEDKLLPDYLMMWFLRKEFDRNTWFYTDADVRGGLSWADFCNMQLPVPSIEKQRGIVKEYKVIKDRIDLNDNLIQKLEDTAQAIYKQWFVDFEFPDENGKQYKSSGGEMEYNEELDKEIPVGWDVKQLGDYILTTNSGDWGKDSPKDNYKAKVCCIRGADIPNLMNGNIKNLPERFILQNNLENKELMANQIVIEISGGSPTQSTGRTIYISGKLLENINNPMICSNFCQVLNLKDYNYARYVYMFIKYLYDLDILFNYENSTIGLKNLDLSGLMKEESIAEPPISVIVKFNKIASVLNDAILSCGKEVSILSEHNDLFIADLILGRKI
jgi:type I restriction enzyme S subunit